eukprot:403351059
MDIPRQIRNMLELDFQITYILGESKKFIKTSSQTIEIKPGKYNIGTHKVALKLNQIGLYVPYYLFEFYVIVLPRNGNYPNINDTNNGQGQGNQSSSNGTIDKLLIVNNSKFISQSLSAKIKSIDSSGIVSIRFSEAIDIPKNYLLFNDNITLVQLLDYNDELIKDIDFTWKNLEMTSNELQLQIDFKNPEQVSKYSDYDQVQVVFIQNGYFRDLNQGLFLPMSYTAKKYIPKQLYNDSKIRNFFKIFKQKYLNF